MSKTLSLEKLKSLFDLIPVCSEAYRLKVYKELIQMLEEKLFGIEMPIYQTEEYIMLRSKLGINSFPYDEENYQPGKSFEGQ